MPAEPQLMRSGTSAYGCPYFQDVPFYSERQSSYTLPEMQHYSLLAETDNAYRYQVEDAASDKEEYCEGPPGSKQLKPNASTSVSKKSGQQVRFSLSTKQGSKASTGAPKVRMQWVSVNTAANIYLMEQLSYTVLFPSQALGRWYQTTEGVNGTNRQDH